MDTKSVAISFCEKFASPTLTQEETRSVIEQIYLGSPQRGISLTPLWMVTYLALESDLPYPVLDMVLFSIAEERRDHMDIIRNTNIRIAEELYSSLDLETMLLGMTSEVCAFMGYLPKGNLPPEAPETVLCGYTIFTKPVPQFLREEVMKDVRAWMIAYAKVKKPFPNLAEFIPSELLTAEAMRMIDDLHIQELIKFCLLFHSEISWE